MPTRKVVKKSASASKGRSAPKRVVKDALISGEANDDAIDSGDASKGGKPKIHAKVVHLLISVGTDDRERPYEDMVADLLKRLDAKPHGKPGYHVTPTGGHYILDGKVCLPDDYDRKKGTFKNGSVPPRWAGGPKHNPNVGVGAQIEYDKANLTKDEYDRKYHIGKYAVVEKPLPSSRLITPEKQRQMREEWIRSRQQKEEAEVEEFDWDDADVEDEEKLSAAADKSAKRAVKRLKSTPTKSASKRVVKKTTTPKPVRKVRRK